MVSPALGPLSPAANSPAESSVPDVESTVDTAPLPSTMNSPLTVPWPVNANCKADDSALMPAAAAPQTHVLRGAVYVGALAPPASVHPGCSAIVSAATGPVVYPTELI